MFDWANRGLAFFHSPGLALIVACFFPLDSAAVPYCAGAVLFIYLALWYYIIIERTHRANQMIKSLAYENLAFDFFYEANGDFRGQCFFKLRNHGTEAVSELPATKAFFLADGTISTIRFRNIDEGSGIYRFKKNGQSIVDTVSALFKNNARLVEWEYEISPPLAPGDAAAYEVNIESQGTECAAFTAAGSIMGFPAEIPVQSATLKAVAPPKHRFVCIGHPIMVDINLTGVVTDGEISLPDPVLSRSSKILDWNVSDLPGGNRYWIKYRFEPELPDDA
jgi:hypothetical protein